MNKSLQIRRGNTTQHSTFVGLEAELTVDTDKFALILHDGMTAGGIELPRLDYVNAQLSTKANAATTLEGYGIGDAYTIDQITNLYYDKTQTDNFLSLKLDAADSYDAETLDILLSAKSDKINTYSQSDVDVILQSYINTNDVANIVNTLITNYINDNSVVLLSPNGTQYKIVVADDGTLSTEAV